MSMQHKVYVSPNEWAYFFHDGMEKEIVNHLDLNILVGGVAKDKNDFEEIHPFKADPFFRFYYMTAGEIELIFTDYSITLRPGNSYLIPASKPFRYSTKKGFSHYWLHFCSELLEKIPHFQHLLEIKSQKETKQMMIDFLHMAEFSKEMKNVMEADIILRRLLIPFLETMPEGDYSRVQSLNRFSPVIEYINHHIADNLTIPVLASMLRMNRNDFSAEFYRVFKIKPKQYICHRRINRAKILLLRTDMTIKEISMQVGYDNEFFFYRLFKKYTEMTPSDFRKNSNLGF